MPKRFLFACAIVAAVFAACNNSNPYDAYVTPSSPTPNPSYSPNPIVTAATVTFSVAATPIPNQPIAMSTPDVAGRPGAAIVTIPTSATGSAAFTGLVATKTYCWTTMYTPSGAQPQNYSICAGPQYWQISPVHIGNP
ncbi:MAG: hypothetical protein M3R51_08685 [Candidatus Eremiobacteraeota bacterium]|nr:hypothetical protein [Candidatus Eremiobacteraeota bacterium]